MINKMKSLLSILILFSFIFSQDTAEKSDTLVTVQDTVQVTIQDTIPDVVPDTVVQQVPSGLDAGYKGLSWGSPIDSQIPTSFSELASGDSLAYYKSYVGTLGTDSAMVSYFFADSGFWKVEIDIIISPNNVEKQIADYRRLEKNISEVYGPPKKMNQQESGPSGSYSSTLEQKFSRAFYRSTWSVTPAIIELLLNASVLLPATELPIFSGNFSVLKLVYYNPDYMHSSQPLPKPEAIPSIFDIY